MYIRVSTYSQTTLDISAMIITMTSTRTGTPGEKRCKITVSNTHM